jgi:ComF family protein
MTLRNKAKTLWHRLWPAHCVVCGGTDFPGALDICPGCATDLLRNGPGCPRCAEPGAPDLCCGRCLKQKPAFDAVISPYVFEFPVDLLIRGLKFRRRLANGRVLGTLLGEHLAEQAEPLPELLIPIPLSSKRLRRRGFNQALEIARPVAERLDIALATGYVRRIRDTREQTGLDALARQRNLRNAFKVIRPVDCAHVCIVDDVVTTGSTANAMAIALKQHGVERVDVWAVARASQKNG